MLVTFKDMASNALVTFQIKDCCVPFFGSVKYVAVIILVAFWKGKALEYVSIFAGEVKNTEGRQW